MACCRFCRGRLVVSKRSTLVLLHGWGSTARVWQYVAGDLQQRYDVVTPELPGHGSNILAGGDIESVARALWQYIDSYGQSVVLLGWSLGGLLAMQMSLQRPECVGALLSVAATPCFVQRDGWPFAMPADVYREFESGFACEPVKAAKRFQLLQANGDVNQKQVMQQLAHAAAQPGKSLYWGLNVLRATCIQSELAQLDCPVASLYGRGDVLVPSAVSASVPGAFEIWEAVGHAPFLSRPAAFVDWVLRQPVKRYG